MEEQSYTSTHPLGHTGPVTGTLYLYLYFCTGNLRLQEMNNNNNNNNNNWELMFTI